MKKKIIIVSHAMEIGGAERALLGLLNSFDYDQYDIDLFLCRQAGELMSLIPSRVNLLPTNNARYLAVPMSNLFKKCCVKMIFGRLKAKLKARKKIKILKLSNDNQIELLYSHLYTLKYIEDININTEYDLAISFLTPHYICKNKTKAKKYIAWIHTDYSTVEIDVNEELKMWKNYNYIVSISNNCTLAFLEKFPSLKDKIVRIDNIITNDMINKQANAYSIGIDMDFDGIKLLSIGRYTHAKNFDNIPAICKKILDLGIKVKWYIIGFGLDENLIKENIHHYGMENYVVLLGKKDNPYPYIKYCDFYVQPSRYEGKSVSVREAQILQKPVIITDFPTASSQLTNGVDGIIVPLDNEKCAQGIVDFIQNSILQNQISKNLMNCDYSNSTEVFKIYELI